MSHPNPLHDPENVYPEDEMTNPSPVSKCENCTPVNGGIIKVTPDMKNCVDCGREIGHTENQEICICGSEDSLQERKKRKFCPVHPPSNTATWTNYEENQEEKTTAEGLREEYKNWVDSFGMEELGYYNKQVADWWLAKLEQERQRMVEKVKGVLGYANAEPYDPPSREYKKGYIEGYKSAVSIAFSLLTNKEEVKDN